MSSNPYIYSANIVKTNARYMNNPILVTTDFSVNAKAGARFAIQLAKQTKSPLVFYHCLLLMKPTRWSEATYDQYVAREVEGAGKAMDRFVRSVLPTGGRGKPRYTTVVQHSTDVKKSIIDYAQGVKARAICMSSLGAGRFKKMIGTHTSAVIHASPIPVFVIPKNYRTTSITRFLYASDLNKIGTELERVSALAKQLKARISVYHYDYLADVDEARENLLKVAKRYKRPGIDFTFRKFNIDKSLGQHLLKDMRKSQASLAVLFTDQKRGWFDSLFMPSRTADVASDARIPMLVFPK